MMWIKLNLSGIDFHFRITKYKPSTKNWDSEWTCEDLTLQSGKWLNYQIKSDELLLTWEVEKLQNCLEELLEDKLPEPTIIGGIEPDLCFNLYPKRDLRLDSKYAYIAPGHEIADIYMELEVHFWDAGLTDNKLIITFYRSDIEKLLYYLQLVTGKLSQSDIKLQKLLSDGTIYGDVK